MKSGREGKKRVGRGNIKKGRVKKRSQERPGAS